MKEAFIAIAGTIVGFLLGWIKELIQSREKLKVQLKEGELTYFRVTCDEIGQLIEEKNIPERATRFKLRLVFDIFNIGKLHTRITDISICIEANKKKLYFRPQMKLPFENKILSNSSFNVEANKVYTIDSSLVIVHSIKDKDLELKIEPISICVA